MWSELYLSDPVNIKKSSYNLGGFWHSCGTESEHHHLRTKILALHSNQAMELITRWS